MEKTIGKPAPKYQPEEYWQKRLGEEFNIRGAALSHLSESYNNWALKAGLRSLSRYICQPPFSLGDVKSRSGLEVLDIGCGTGNIIKYWRRLGIGHLTGLDLTRVSVANLRNLFPEHDFFALDITDEATPKTLGKKFDIISAMNVLLHVTDNKKFAQAIRNMSRLLKDKGLLVIADPIICRQYRGEPFNETSISRCRQLREYQEIMAPAQLRVVRVWPTTFFMSNPIDAKNAARFWILNRIWGAISRLSRREKIGEIVGRTLYLVEGMLPKFLEHGASGKFLVATK